MILWRFGVMVVFQLTKTELILSGFSENDTYHTATKPKYHNTLSVRWLNSYFEATKARNNETKQNIMNIMFL